LRGVFVGRLEEIKGVDLLVDVFRRHPDWRLTIVGTGSLHRVLAEHAEGADNVDLVGAVAPENVRGILDAHDVLLLPGTAGQHTGRRTEGLPTVLLEAFAAGRPVVAGAQGGVGEVVDDRVGFLIPPGDGQALEGALIALAGNYELQEVLGTNARDRASQFDFRAVGRLMLEQFS